MIPFHNILLIDDDEATNYIHKIVFKKANYRGIITSVESAEEALEHITSNPDTPDLILLDINMPRMNGWEFLEEYQNLHLEKQPIIYIVSTSLNPNDKLKSESHSLISGFIAKPLSIDMVEQLKG